MSNAQEIIISSMLRTPGRHESRLSGLDPEWFTDKALRAWLRALRARPMGFEAAPGVLDRAVKNEATRGLLLGALPELQEYPAYHDADVDNAARELADVAKRAHILDRSRWIVESVKEGRLSVAEEAAKLLSAEMTRFDPFGDPPQGVGDLADIVRREYETTSTSGGAYFRTGVMGLDSRMGGGKRGEMWLIGGYTGDGKTNTLLNIAHHTWLNGHNGLWIPREMTTRQMTVMFIVRHSAELFPESPLTAKPIFAGTLTADDKEKFHTTAQDIKRREKEGARLRFWSAPRKWSIEDLAKYLEGEKHRMSIDMLVVDMLAQLYPVRTRDPRAELNETLGAAKQFALSYNGGRGLWLASPHQINRDGRKECEKRKPTPHYLLSDLAESSRAEQDSDVVLWILRTARLKAHRQALIGMPKCRGDEPIEMGFKVMADFASAYLGNIDKDEAAPDAADFDDVT